MTEHDKGLGRAKRLRLALSTLYLMCHNHTIIRAALVCVFVCSLSVFVPYLLRGPLTDLRQTWWVYVGGPRNCP